MFKHILIAYDGTPGAEQAMKQALGLARQTGAALTALSVEETLPAYAATVGEAEMVWAEMEEYFTRVQTAAVARASAVGIALQTAIRRGHTAQTVVRFAEENGCDLIVVGSDGWRGLGSTADRITESAHCSVLVVRAHPLSMRARDVMSASVTSVSRDTPLAQVADLLIQRNVKAVPVIENGRVVGIITGGDLLQRAGMGLRLSLQRALPAEALAEQLRQLAAQGRIAADVMSAPVITVGEDARVSEVARIMADRRVKRLPVIDAQGTLVGIISRLDVLSTVTTAPQAGDLLPISTAGAPQTAGDVMFRDVPTVEPEASLNEVLDKLVASSLRRVVVVGEKQRVVGIVLDADLLTRFSRPETTGLLRALIARLSYTHADAPDLTGRAADIMTREVYTVREDTPLGVVVQTMVEKGVKRLVVVDQEGRLAGMVDRQTVLSAFAG